MSDDEQFETRPHTNPTGNCIKCHKKLKLRKPSDEERKIELQALREKYDVNVTKPEDIKWITDTCECGQKGAVFYVTDMDKLK